MKLNKINKQLFIGVIMGIIISSSLPLLANASQYILSKVNYKIIVDGTEYTPRNDVLSYQGTTYLPLRDLSSALGLNLTFSDGVINIDSTPTLNINGTTDSINTNIQPGKHARTLEETEEIIEKYNIPTDSAIAKELRENLDSNFNPNDTLMIERKSKITEKENIFLSAIDGYINVSDLSREEARAYSGLQVSRSTNSLSYDVGGKKQFILFENLPKDVIGETRITSNDKVVGSTRGGFINDKIYIDKSFLESLQ